MFLRTKNMFFQHPDRKAEKPVHMYIRELLLVRWYACTDVFCVLMEETGAFNIPFLQRQLQGQIPEQIMGNSSF